MTHLTAKTAASGRAVSAPAVPEPPPPLAALAELTHRCPMQCAYCSNPLALDAVGDELTTDQWRDVIDQVAALGALQIHFSGGEPALRADLPDLVAHARDAGLYVNLITSGLPLTDAKVRQLADRGLDHVQLAFQDVTDAGIAVVTNVPKAFDRKVEVARAVTEAGLALTANLVITRHTTERVGEMIDLAHTLGAGRCEVANVQYYGWGLLNRAALIPTRAALDRMSAVVEARRRLYDGRMVIDYVIPDYHANRPKACMGGWGRRFLNITPTGKVLPCHAAETIPDLVVETVRDRPLEAIWRDGPAFTLYRGDAWMPPTCKSCDRKEVDWGGCRCQALALAGRAEAIDPVCAESPLHATIQSIAESEGQVADPTLVYRGAPPRGSSSSRTE